MAVKHDSARLENQAGTVASSRTRINDAASAGAGEAGQLALASGGTSSNCSEVSPSTRTSP
jgi:hypothetical protein